MLAKAPSDRFPGADAAWDALEDVVLELLGPRWRREARLVDAETATVARPLTPATFEGNERSEPAPSRRMIRRRAGVVAVIAAIAGGAVAVGFAAAGSGTPRHTADARVPAILRALDQTQAGDVAQLQRAASATAQAAVASKLEDAYRSAARQLRALPRTSGSAALAREVSDTASEYGLLARAARTGNRVSYRRAAARISSDEALIRVTAGHL
jgi:hypothetical protein